MGIAILLIFLLPVGLIILVFFAIGTAVGRTYRATKRAYGDVKPYVNSLVEQASEAQRKVENMSERGTRLTGTVEEISGRVAFIAETVLDLTQSPTGRLTELAARFLEGAD